MPWSRAIIERWAASPHQSGLSFGWLNPEHPSASLVWSGDSPTKLALKPAGARCSASPFRARARLCAQRWMPKLRAEQAKDRAYWAPLIAEFEAFRRAEHEGS